MIDVESPRSVSAVFGATELVLGARLLGIAASIQSVSNTISSQFAFSSKTHGSLFV